MNDHEKNTARKREIVEVMEARKQTRSTKNFYKAQADEHRGELLAADIDRKIEGLKKAIARERVDWNDLHDVRRRSLEYLECCKEAQAIPTVSGLAVFALGVTRQALNLYLREHPNTPTAVFLSQVKDCFSDVLETSALTRNIDSVMSIFVMKNDHDRADRVQLEPVTTAQPLGESVDRAALEQRIAGSVIVDDD